jgi:hypothetical protein
VDINESERFASPPFDSILGVILAREYLANEGRKDVGVEAFDACDLLARLGQRT